MARRDAKALARILEAERRALLQGKVPEIAVLGEAKARAVAEITADRDAVVTARAGLARNARMIQAAIAGLRAARDRGGERRALEKGFSTYRRSGDKVWIGPERGRGTGTGEFASNAAHRASRD